MKGYRIYNRGVCSIGLSPVFSVNGLKRAKSLEDDKRFAMVGILCEKFTNSLHPEGKDPVRAPRCAKRDQDNS